MIATVDEAYAPYEVKTNPVALPNPRAQPTPLAELITQCGYWMSRWKEVIAASPLESRGYTVNELNTDPRFHALFSWGHALATLLIELQANNIWEAVLPPGRPRTDAAQFLTHLNWPGGVFAAVRLIDFEKTYFEMVRLTSYFIATRAVA